MAEETALGWLQEVDALLAYCSRFDEGFSAAIQPASARDMAELESLAGQPFPPEYRAWLLRMGRTPYQALGAFLDDIAFGVDAVTEFYTNPPAPVPSDAIYLWTANEDAEMFLSTRVVANGPRPVLHFSWPVDPSTGRFLDRSGLPITPSTACCGSAHGLEPRARRARLARRRQTCA